MQRGIPNIPSRGHRPDQKPLDSKNKIEQEIEQIPPAPEGWMTIAMMAEKLNTTGKTITNKIKILKEKGKISSNDYGEFRHPKINRVETFYSPDVFKLVKEEIEQTPLAPEGWMTIHMMAEKLGTDRKFIRRIINELRENNLIGPNNSGEFRHPRGGIYTFYSPDVFKLVKQKIEQIPLAPEDWMTIHVMAKNLRKSKVMIENIIKNLEKKGKISSNDYGEFRHPETGKIYTFYSPYLFELVKKEIEKIPLAPEDWMTIKAMAKELGVYPITVKNIINKLIKNRLISSEHYGEFRHPKINRVETFYSPYVFKLVKEEIKEYRKSKKEKLENIEEFLEEVSDMDKKEKGILIFRSLMNIFGSAGVFDIILIFFPYAKEFQPRVRKYISKYLGDFLITTPSFNDIKNSLEFLKEEAIETFKECLSDPKLREILETVLKAVFAGFYKEKKKEHPSKTDREIVDLYIEELEKLASDLQINDFTEVVNNIKQYFDYIFKDFIKPENIVERLSEDREFPDIHQIMDVMALKENRKILLAQEMGTGKSASVIFAKEVLTESSPALLIVPSNVIETWKRYLSDKHEEGRQIGYFRKGKAPKVLILEQETFNEDLSNYDYVIISQEKLTIPGYLDKLLEFKNFGMLVVDEIHKLKNIKHGKRAKSLIKIYENLLKIVKELGKDKYVALLSGTPIPNKIEDIAVILKILHPDKFGEISDRDLIWQIKQGGIVNIRALLLPYMRRRNLEDIVDLPPLIETTKIISLTPEEEKLYEELLNIDEHPFHKITILRKFLLNPNSVISGFEMVGSKINALNEILYEFLETKNKRKIVVFINNYIEGIIKKDEKSNDILQFLKLPSDVEIKLIHGEISQDERLEIQKEINESDKRLVVFISGQTAGLGIDLSGADAVVFYNEPWTLPDKEQQLHRVYRPGIKSELESVTIIVKDTIEEGMHKYILAKYKIILKILHGLNLSEVEKAVIATEGSDSELLKQLAIKPIESKRLMKLIGIIKKGGRGSSSEEIQRFIRELGKEFAEEYHKLLYGSYQANSNIISSTILEHFIEEDKKNKEEVIILDAASGPEMLKTHISEKLQDRVISIDINPYHFFVYYDPESREFKSRSGGKRMIGFLTNLPFSNNSIDYINLSFALEEIGFSVKENIFDRLLVIKEFSRVLKIGGKAVISLLYSTELKDLEKFKNLIRELGFKIKEEYSGRVFVQDRGKMSHYSKIYVLEKERELSSYSLEDLIEKIGIENLKGLEFKTILDSRPRISKKVVESFMIESIAGGRKEFQSRLNQQDLEILTKEEEIIEKWRELIDKYKTPNNVPEEILEEYGFKRVIIKGKTIVIAKIPDYNLLVKLP